NLHLRRSIHPNPKSRGIDSVALDYRTLGLWMNKDSRVHSGQITATTAKFTALKGDIGGTDFQYMALPLCIQNRTRLTQNNLALHNLKIAAIHTRRQYPNTLIC